MQVSPKARPRSPSIHSRVRRWPQPKGHLSTFPRCLPASMQFNLLPKSPEQPAQRSYVYDKNAYCTKRIIVKIVWCSNLFSPLFGYCDRLYYLCNQLITLQKQNNLLTPTHNESQLSINPVADTLLSPLCLCTGDSLHRLDAEQSLSARWRIGAGHWRA